MALIIKNHDSIVITYRRLLTELLSYGERIAPRGLATRAIRNVIIELDDPSDVLLTDIGRGLSTGLLALEPLQLVGGFSDPELTVAVVPRYADFRDDSEFYGAYGLRTGHKVELLADKLKRDPYTRQAYMTVWEDELDHVPGKHDYPCTVGVHYQLGADDRLHGTTTMRSNDAWLGFPYDIVQHTSLLKAVAKFAGLEAGTYTHVVHNMHLYERDVNAARELLNMPIPTNLPDRRRLVGGIGSGDESEWWQVQQRARHMLAEAYPITWAATPEERWYLDAVDAMYTKLIHDAAKVRP